MNTLEQLSDKRQRSRLYDVHLLWYSLWWLGLEQIRSMYVIYTMPISVSLCEYKWLHSDVESVSKLGRHDPLNVPIQQHPGPITPAEVCTALLRVWIQLPMAFINRLEHSMYRRYVEMINVRGCVGGWLEGVIRVIDRKCHHLNLFFWRFMGCRNIPNQSIWHKLIPDSSLAFQLLP